MATLTAHRAPAAVDITVAFVDIVGFTRLCDGFPVRGAGALVDWLERAAFAAAREPVRVAKLVGDAAMLVGPEPAGVVAAALEIMHSASRDPSAPPLHAGLASGRALSRDGDWLGRPVNLANHLATGAARGTLECSLPVARATRAIWPWTPLGPRRIAGLDGPRPVYRMEA